MKKSSGEKYKGFSLIELLTVIFVSFVLAGAVGEIFLSGMQSYGTVADNQRKVEEGRSILESMAKNMSMSNNLKYDSANSAIYMFNTTQNKCISYKFDHTTPAVFYAECNPPDPQATDVCDATGGATPCSGSVNYSSYYASMSQEPIDGNVNIVSTDRKSNPPVVGKATVSLMIGAAGSPSRQTLETTVSFRDYAEIIQ